MSSPPQESASELIVLEVDRLREAWLCKQRDQKRCIDGGTVVKARDYGSGAVDIEKALRDFGIQGKFEVRTTGAKQFVVFKGRPGARRFWRGTRLAMASDRAAVFAIGTRGFATRMSAGFGLTIVFACHESIINAALGVIPFEQLGFHLAVDFAKATIAGVIASAGATLAVDAALAIGATAAPVIIAVGASVVIGLLVAEGLDAVDERWMLRDRLVSAMESAWNDLRSLPDSAAREIWRLERGLMQFVMCQSGIQNAICQSNRW